MAYLITTLIRLVLAPFILIIFSLEFIIVAGWVLLRWIFTGEGVNVQIGPLKIGY